MIGTSDGTVARMLIGLDPLLTPELLHALASMGHGDEIAIVDANFPAAANARRLLALDGVDAPRALQAVLSIMPLDGFVPHPAVVMAVVGAPHTAPPVVADFSSVLRRAIGRDVAPAPIERHAFYARAREAYAVLRTGERRFYGNIIVAKGVLDADGRVPPPRA
jgi:L-fucose mutarotase